MQLTEIRRYPVKSCRGESLSEAVVEPWGLAGDRRWMLVDPDGAALTAREVNELVLVQPELMPGGLRVVAAGTPGPLDVRAPRGARVPVTLFGSTFEATPAADEAHAWFTRLLGRDARLVWLDDPTRRPTSADWSEPGDRVSLADGFPLLVTTEESLTALNDELLARTQGAEEPMTMTRFRPNVVVTGAAAWAEDDWRRVRVGDAVLRAVKGCARCVLTTVDPDTAQRGREPIATLARIRRYDSATWFGVNLVPDTPGVTIRVGDPVEVLDVVAPGAGPIRRRIVG